MKYATGTYITRDGDRRKILSAHDSVRDVSCSKEWHDNWETTMSGSSTVERLEQEGWKEEKAPWEPTYLEEYTWIDGEGNKITETWRDSPIGKARLAIGNCYDPNDQEAIDAAIERVKKAYKG